MTCFISVQGCETTFVVNWLNIHKLNCFFLRVILKTTHTDTNKEECEKENLASDLKE